MQRNTNKTSDKVFSLVASSLLILTPLMSHNDYQVNTNSIGNHQDIATNIHLDHSGSQDINNLSKISLKENALVPCPIKSSIWSVEYFKWNIYCQTSLILDNLTRKFWNFPKIDESQLHKSKKSSPSKYDKVNNGI